MWLLDVNVPRQIAPVLPLLLTQVLSSSISSPAIVNGEIFLRSQTSLFCIREMN